MTFVEELVRQDLPLWEDCLHTEFLRRMADGTLDEACFKGYIVEDTLYLREYAKVFAWGMTKAESMETVRHYYSLLSFVNEGEGATRLYYLDRYGLTDAQIEPLPLRPENQAYVDCMIAAAKDGEGEAECMMACLPCMLSYGWLFQELVRRAPQVKQTPFWPMVRDYAGPDYADACRRWAQHTERVCAGLSGERRQRCREIFHACSVHELRFWEMSARPRSDVD